jgi:hypothetical protein
MCLPESREKPNMMLPLRMDMMYVKEQSCTLQISCPQEHCGDKEDWIVLDSNLYLQSY